MVNSDQISTESKSQFTRILVVSPLVDGKTWILMQELSYFRVMDGTSREINVSMGFLTDFASVPWFVQWWIPRWGKYGNPAILHDWLYWNQYDDMTRAEADRTLLDAMHVTGVDILRKYAIYGAVRCFGWFAWLRNKEDRDSGFARVRNCAGITPNYQSKRVGAFRQVFRAIKRHIQKAIKERINPHAN